MENSRREGEELIAMSKRICPGRLTREEWQTVTFLKRLELIKRAQCDLLISFRFCANKRALAAFGLINAAAVASGVWFGHGKRRGGAAPAFPGTEK